MVDNKLQTKTYINMKNLFAIFATFAMLCAVGCEEQGSGDDVTPNNKPNLDQVVDDPEGTISLKMRNENDGKTFLGDSGIYIDVADNFSGAKFASIGAAKGLGNVTFIPRSGWTDKVAVNPGEAYVAYSEGMFYRLYVEDYILNVSQEILGASVKYQYPFGGCEPLVFSTTSINNAGVVHISGANNTIADFTVSCQSDCGVIRKVYDDIHKFLPVGFSFEPYEQEWHFSDGINFDIVVESFSGKQTKIATTITGPDPYIAAPDTYTTYATRRLISMEELGVYVNFDPVDLKIQSDSEWCRIIDNHTLDVANNYKDTPRTATITLSSDKYPDLTQTTTIHQQAAEFEVELQNYEDWTIVEGSANSDYYINFYTHNPHGFSWSVKSDCEWIEIQNFSSPSYENYPDLRLSIAENLEGQTRVGKLIFFLGDSEEEGINCEFEITQRPHTFQFSSSVVNFDRTQTYSSVVLTTTASSFSAVSSKDWCTLSWNDKTMTVRVTANDTNSNRSAIIDVTLNDGQTTQVEVNQGRYAVGDLYDVGGVQGVVFETSGHHGKIVSLDETTSQYSIENVLIGADDNNDGKINMEVVKAIPTWEELYPAFKWCADKGEGWYLPAINELTALEGYAYTLANSTLSANGYTTLGTSYYWSSTESSNIYAYHMSFLNRRTYADSKQNSYNVRAVLAF